MVHEEILVAEGCASWLADRETLWNHVEALEKRVDARLGREINLALPVELSAEERLELVRAFAREQFVALGMVVDIAIHAPVTEKGDDPRNHHAHLLMTDRAATPLGLRRVKTREWNSESLLLKWREAWAFHQNKALREKGHASRVDHRSLAVQRANALAVGDLVRARALERQPEVHVGPKASKAIRAVRRIQKNETPSEVAKPRSKDRPVGPVRRKPGGKRSQRVILYTLFDQGSRAQFNSRRLQRNALNFLQKAAKVQRHIARLRTRQAYYVKRIRESETKAATGQDRASAWERTLHARQRAAQIRWLITELDRLFFELLHLRENQLVRFTVWTNRFAYWRQDLPHLHVRGRARSR